MGKEPTPALTRLGEAHTTRGSLIEIPAFERGHGVSTGPSHSSVCRERVQVPGGHRCLLLDAANAAAAVYDNARVTSTPWLRPVVHHTA